MSVKTVMSPSAVVTALRRAWFPVARAQDLTSPQPQLLLGERLVVFRQEDGKAAVTDRRCPHRGGNLAAGVVKGTAIECPYHGWKFDGATGACAGIPSLPAGSRIPAVARVKAYPTIERYGLVWTCLDEPLIPLPNLPELEGLGMTFLVGRPIATDAGILASAENFCDMAHFRYVHSSTMGNVSPEIEPLEFRSDGYQTWLSRTYAVGGGTAGTYVFSDGITVHYHSQMPGLVSGRFDYGSGGQRIILECFQPLGPTGCIIYPVSGTAANYTISTPEVALADEEFVINEDKSILDGLWPLEVQLDRSALELSVAADKFTLGTREAFRSFVASALHRD